MKAKVNHFRTLAVLTVMLAGMATALFGVGLRTAEPQTTTPKMQVQDLGTLGGVYSYATDINDSGQVVGFSFTSTGAQHAFLYDGSAATPKMQDLGTLGGLDSRATGINNSGKVVGYSNTSTGEQHGFLYDSTNGMKDLNDLIPADSGGTIYEATAINTNGKIAATVFKPSGTDPDVCQYENYSGGWTYATVLTPATTATYEVQNLGTLGGDYSAAAGMNDSGKVVGYSMTSSCVDDAFLYDSTNGMQDLGTLGGPYSAATGINDSGKVVGYSADTYQSCTNNCFRAFLYDGSAATPKMQDLGTLGGHSSAWGINDSGTVVGYSYVWGSREDHGFLKESGQPMIDLNTLLPADSGWTIRDARAVNTDGQIAATGYKDGVGQRALLLTPTGDSPPPSDTQAPSPPTITSPPNNTYDSDGSFSVSGSAEAGSTVELFEGTTSRGTTKASSSGAWSIALSGVSEGAHTYTAKATDAAGNTSSVSNSVTVTVDTTQPMVNGTTPSGGATSVARGTNLTATFSEQMGASTVNATTFKLYKVNADGTQTQITDVVVSLSSNGLTATLNPFGAKTTLLVRSTKYKGVITTGTKDLAGNPLALQRSWTFTTKS